jgi:hypothetical protein
MGKWLTGFAFYLLPLHLNGEFAFIGLKVSRGQLSPRQRRFS